MSLYLNEEALKMATDTTAKPKRDLFYVHVAITLFFMFGFGLIPPVGAITPLGMKLVGIFIGLVYAWSTTSLIWPSLLGMTAVMLTGVMSMNEFVAASWGNSTVVFMFLIMIFAGVIDELGLVDYLANWFVSRKIVFGRPWVFSFLILFGAFISGMLVNSFAATIIFWSIFYGIANKLGYKPYDKYCTLMLFGICFCAMTLGLSVAPYRMTGLLVMATLKTASGVAVSFGQWIAYIFPCACILVVTYVLIMRFIFRPDVSPLKQLDESFVDRSQLKLNKKQKIGMAYLAICVILLLAPEMLPKTMVVQQKVSQIGINGIVLLLIAMMFVTKVDGQSIMNFKSVMSKGISWDLVILFAIVLPLSSLLTNDATGIKPFIVGIMVPILSKLSPMVITIVVTLSLALLTNVANNAVLLIIFINVFCPIAMSLDMNPVPIVMSLVWFAQFAYMTPAASGPAALIFGNTDWIRAKDIYKMFPIMFIGFYLVTFIVLIPFAKMLF